MGSGLSGTRTLSGLDSKIKSARWIDNNEILALTPTLEDDLLTIHLTPYPYGSQLVVRVAELQSV